MDEFIWQKNYQASHMVRLHLDFFSKSKFMDTEESSAKTIKSVTNNPNFHCIVTNTSNYNPIFLLSHQPKKF